MLNNLKQIAGGGGSAFFNAAKSKISNQTGGAFPGLGSGQLKDVGSSLGHRMMNRIGRPMGAAAGRGRTFVSNENDLGGSLRQVYQNQGDRAQGKVRTPNGDLMDENDAADQGFSAVPSRYGGNVVSNPHSSMLGKRQARKQGRQERRQERRAQDPERRQRIFGGILKTAGQVGKMFEG